MDKKTVPIAGTATERKREEIDYHNLVRGEEVYTEPDKYLYYYSNVKYYSINRKVTSFWENWLLRRCQGKRVLEYGCGSGTTKTWMSAKNGATTIGIDISDVSVRKATQRAIGEGVERNAAFIVMDCENLGFGDDSFDIIIVAGVLHHLDVRKAFPELARVLRPDGEIICIDPLAYNPVIQLYRKMTPQLRTEWETEHIMGKKELNLAKRYFGKLDITFFHLATLAAVPFRKLPLFKGILSFMEALDSVLLKLPGVRWLAWQMVFILSQPIKSEARKQEVL